MIKVRDHINFKMGTLSGLFTGSVVFFINFNHGLMPGLLSFGKQFIFNLLMAGYNSKTCEKIANKFNHTGLSLFLATIIPTIQAFAVLYAVHYFGGTPKPMESTLWQAFANLGVFFILGYTYQNGQESKLVRWLNSWDVEKKLIRLFNGR